MPELFDENTTDVRSAATQTYLIASLDSPEAVLYRQGIVESFMGPGAVTTYFTRGGLEVAFQLSKSPTRVLLALSGMRSPRAAAELLRSWSSATATASNSDFTNYVETQAALILNQPGAAFANDARTFFVIGHSLGGGIAYAVAATLKRNNPQAWVKVCTYGAPKVASDNALRFSPGLQSTRWVGEGDYVTCIPPLLSQAPTLYGAMTAGDRHRVLAWRHLGMASKISRVGVVSIESGDYNLSNALTTTLSNTLNAQDGRFGPDHQIAGYVDRFRIARANLPANPPVMPVAPLAIVVPPPTTPAEIAAAGLAINAFAAQARTNDAIIPVLPKQTRFGYYKVRPGFWMLTLANSDIALAPSKRKAIACARHGNRMLRLFQGVGESFSVSFVVALANYLYEAQQPANGFAPILHDSQGMPWDLFNEGT